MGEGEEVWKLCIFGLFTRARLGLRSFFCLVFLGLFVRLCGRLGAGCEGKHLSFLFLDYWWALGYSE